MGGFNGITTALGAVGKVVDITQSARKTYGDVHNVQAGYNAASDRYTETERDIAERAALTRQQSDLATAEATRVRKNALQRAVATRQAAFGGQGIDTTDGSGEAVMLGLFKESDAQRQYAIRTDALKRQADAQDTATKRRRNLLTYQQDTDALRTDTIRNFDKYYSGLKNTFQALGKGFSND